MLQLLAIKYGPGAIIVPPAPAPQLVSLSLIYARRDNVKPSRNTYGARHFEQECLPRFKYYNPGVKVDILHTKNMRHEGSLTLEFAADPNAVTPPSIFRVVTPHEIKIFEGQPSIRPRADPQTATPELPASDEEAVLEPQPPTDSAVTQTFTPPSQPPPAPRKVTLRTKHRPPGAIAKWLEMSVGGTRAKITKADQDFIHNYQRKEQIAANTKEVMKGVTAKLKEEQASLAKAKKAADAFAQGNAAAA